MSWVVVPCLLEGRSQLNNRFPNRAKNAEGTIGDTSHQASASSHNPDLTGSPEYRDGDSQDEVRAWDADKNLNDKVTMEQVVQLWITKARSGAMWWVRYLIYNGRIWHKRDGFVTHTYTGSDNHSSHVHVNSDFTQAADTATGTNWHLSELGGGSTPPPATHPAPGPAVAFPLPRGYYFGPKDGGDSSVSGYFNRTFNGKTDRQWLQEWTDQLVRRGWSVGQYKTYLTHYGNDGYYGAEYRTLIEAFQRDQNLSVDGQLGYDTWTAAYHNPVS
jgi:Putative peptidoglycan binding domain